jgi:hypothetical protein
MILLACLLFLSTLFIIILSCKTLLNLIVISKTMIFVLELLNDFENEVNDLKWSIVYDKILNNLKKNDITRRRKHRIPSKVHLQDGGSNSNENCCANKDSPPTLHFR